MHSAIPMKTVANNGKNKKIAAILPAWQNALHAYTLQYKKNHYRGAPNPKLAKTTPQEVWFNTELSARQLKSAHNQAHKAWTSYLALLEREIRAKITKSSLPKEDKTVLYRINKQRAWYKPDLKLDWLVNEKTGELSTPTPNQRKNPEVTIIRLPADKALAKLARNMVKHARTSAPNLKNCNSMEMDAAICERQEGGNSFTQWLRISTLEKRKPVYVPLAENPYYEAAPGKTASLVHVLVRDGIVSINLIKESEDAPLRKGDNPAFLDANFSDNLFSTADGELLGGKFVKWAKEMDGRILAREQYCKKNGIPLKQDKQYNSMIARVRAFTKNEINRIINKLLADKSVTEIVFEKLDFRAPGLSRKFNRLLSKMGRRVFASKMERVRESHGVVTTAYNAAYSSQECSDCHYVSRKNRSVRNVFDCQCCPLVVHADVNSPRVLRARRSSSASGKSDPYAGLSVENTRALIMERHSRSCVEHAGLLSRVASADNSVSS